MKYILVICFFCILSIGFIGYAALITLNGDVVYNYSAFDTRESIGITFRGNRADEPTFSLFYSHSNNANGIVIEISLVRARREWLTSYSLNSNMRFSLSDKRNVSGAFELKGDYSHIPLYVNYELGVLGMDMLPSITNYPLSYFDVDKFRISASGSVKMLLGKLGKVYGNGTFYFIYPRYRANINISIPNSFALPLFISAGKEFFDDYDIGIGNNWESIQENAKIRNDFAVKYFARSVPSFGIEDELKVTTIGYMSGEYILSGIVGYGNDDRFFYSFMGYGKIGMETFSFRGGFRCGKDFIPTIYTGISLRFE